MYIICVYKHLYKGKFLNIDTFTCSSLYIFYSQNFYICRLLQMGAFIRFSNLCIIIKNSHIFTERHILTLEYFLQTESLRSGTFYTKSSVCKDFFIQRFYTYSHTNHFETQIFLGHKNNTEIFFTHKQLCPTCTFLPKLMAFLALAELSLPAKKRRMVNNDFPPGKKLDIRLEILWTQICFVGHLLPWWAFQMPIVECSKTCVIPLHCLFK